MTGKESPSASQPLICVVGPTAVGKTALAVELARRFGGEVINADSRQVYRGMTIGTAKPTPGELAAAPHHLVDILDPWDGNGFGLALFLRRAADALQDIGSRGLLPIVCGGTGQYVWALVEGQHVPAVPPDPQLRASLEAEAALWGADALHRRLADVDPVRAAALDPRNVRRVIRALEIHLATGRRPSEFQPIGNREHANALVIGLTMPRDALYQRIDERVDRMMLAGFLEEVEALASTGLRMDESPLDSPGYRELGQYLAGSLSLEEAVQRTKTQTHRLARRQYAWFKLTDSHIHWLDVADPGLLDRAAGIVASFMDSQSPVIQ